MAAASKALGFGQLALRILQFCASVIILGIFSYFLAVLGDHDMPIGPWVIAVEVISGVATLYTITAAICLPLSRKSFFGGLAMAWDFVFGAAMIAIAIMARAGANSCHSRVNTPLGSGNANDPAAGFGGDGFGVGDGQQLTYMVDLGLACRLQKAAFAVSIIGIFLFLVSMVTQRLYTVQHRDGRQSPSGSKKSSINTSKHQWRFWPFKRQKRPTEGRSSSAVDYYNDEHSVGSIPLSDQPSPAKQPPRYTRIFGIGKKNSNRNSAFEPQKAANQQSNPWDSGFANSPTDHYVNPSTGGDTYGYRGPQPNYTSPRESPYSRGWSGYDRYATYDYDHGPSGVDYSSSTAHGYGSPGHADPPYPNDF